MAEKIDTGVAIYQSPNRSFRFSCYELDENGNTVLNPVTGLPKKLHFSLQNKQLKVTNPVHIKSIDGWLAYHTQDIVKKGEKVGTVCGVKLKKFSEAEFLQLQEPEKIAITNEAGESVAVTVEELKAAWSKAQANQEPIQAGTKVKHGTRTSQDNPKGGA